MSAALLAITMLFGVAVAKEPPPIRIAYFVPSDRQPIDGYVKRLDRVMTEVQAFYRKGMEEAGYGPKTFRLDRDAQGRLRVDLVRGQHPMHDYGRNDAHKVREEVKGELARQGIDVDRQTLVIFQVLLDWEGSKATEIGPFVGSGNHLAGTAWVYDDPHLDPRLLSSKDPGGYYGGPCSLGQFNSHYLGGLAHELGHAFGLPHTCQQKTERAERGLSLMGGGNHTYGQQQRGEGPGTFLSAASAMQLAYSRPFAGEQKDARSRTTCRLADVDATFTNGKLVLTGAVVAQPPAFGIVALDDWAKIPADYDAVGRTCKIDERGRFRLEVGEMRPGLSQLRLKVCHISGATSKFAFDYEVDSQGKPNLDVFRSRFALDEAMAAYATGDRAKVRALAADLQRRFRDVPEVRGKVSHLLKLIEAGPPRPLAELVAENGWVSMTRARFRSASTGWAPRCATRCRSTHTGSVSSRWAASSSSKGSMRTLRPNTSWSLTGIGLASAAPTACRTATRGRWSSWCVATARNSSARPWSRIRRCESWTWTSRASTCWSCRWKTAAMATMATGASGSGRS